MRDVSESELSHIRVTPEALRAIARIRDFCRNIMFHVTLGCCDARSPLCLEAGELRLGSRDVLIGFAGDVPIYEMIVGDDAPPPRDYILDVIPGTSVGFSLDAGSGHRFTLREALSPHFWKSAVATA
jgi:uncharacterized protein